MTIYFLAIICTRHIGFKLMSIIIFNTGKEIFCLATFCFLIFETLDFLEIVSYKSFRILFNIFA